MARAIAEQSGDISRGNGRAEQVALADIASLSPEPIGLRSRLDAFRHSRYAETAAKANESVDDRRIGRIGYAVDE